MKVFVALMLLFATALPQDAPTIKVDVQLREIVATVRDRTTGAIVRKLRPSDFTIEENGEAQTIAHFSDDAEEPISLGLLIDSSGSMSTMPGGALSGVTAAGGIARILLRELKPNDEVALMSFSEGVFLEQAFTKDLRKIDSAVSELRAAGRTSVLTAIGPALKEVGKSRYRKRALIVMTDAFFGGDPAQMAREVSGAEVPIFAFAMRGVDFGLQHPPGQACTSACHQFETFPNPGSPSGFRNMTQPLLDVLADESGGRAMIFEMHPRNTIERILDAIDDIAAELRGQYVLGYYPTKSTAGTVRVRMQNPNYRVHIRRDDRPR
jgi:VWFA-related protein